MEKFVEVFLDIKFGNGLYLTKDDVTTPYYSDDVIVLSVFGGNPLYSYADDYLYSDGYNTVDAVSKYLGLEFNKETKEMVINWFIRKIKELTPYGSNIN